MLLVGVVDKWLAIVVEFMVVVEIVVVVD